MDSSPKPTLHREIVDALGRDIVSGELPAGQRFTIDELQQRHGASRTVIRDVIQVLQSLRLLAVKRRVGLIVEEPSAWSVFDPQIIAWRLETRDRARYFSELTALRIAVEPIAAAAAARNMSAAERENLLTLEAKMRTLGEAGKLDEFLIADQEFHAAILSGSQNSLFASLCEVIGEVLAERTRQGLMPRKPEPEALSGHNAVAHHIAHGDAPAAEAAMHGILLEVREAMGW